MNSYSIIITASFIPSHPSIDLIKTTIESLHYISMNKDTPIILAHDYSTNSKFIEYLTNLNEYISNKPAIKLVVRDSHGCLTGNIRNAFNYVTTEYVLLIQHDLPFIKSFEIEKVIEDMRHTPELKHIRFNKRATIKIIVDALNDLFGKQITSQNYTYTRTPGWSDNNHLCHSDYYRNIILKECPDGSFMEHFVHGKSTTEETHAKYGTYIFGKLNESAYITHTDGRNTGKTVSR